MEPNTPNEPNQTEYQPITSTKQPNKRNRLIVTIVLITLLLIIGVMLTKNSKSSDKSTNDNSQNTVLIPKAAVVSVTSAGFEPGTITISAGQSVEWTNNDSANHKIASDPHPTDDALSGLNSDLELAPKDVFSYKFENAGTYTYHDEKNPLEIKGTVIVE